MRLVWLVDPERRTLTVHTSPEQDVTLGESDSLDGGEVLPGFSPALTSLFAKLDRQAQG